ncbi:hypothetical protein J7M23_00905 [Candidatus Sumerlaeota bacterium]|nr:hypothetical protein [Candidatus Sumerlaeota bacterium]
MKKILILLLVFPLIGIVFPVSGQVVVENTYNFDDGTLQGFVKIYRYDDDPTVVTTDSDFPAAFPPPSGSYAIRSADDDNTFYGLGSAIGGTVFDRTSPSFTSATLEAKIYIVESTSTTEHNSALIAIHQGDASTTEEYYRFGYRNGTVYLQKFDGASFTLLGEDASLPGEHMAIPGWNLFTLQFVGSDTINCSVNGFVPSFSPVTDTEPGIDTAIQIGMLGFSYSSQDPILGDDFHEKIVTTGASVENWCMY